MARGSTPRLSPAAKMGLLALTLMESGMVVARVRRTRLPDLVRHLQTAPHRVALPPLDPRRLGRIVARILNHGPFRPRCLTMSLVLFRLLVRQGTPAHLVIGLPPNPSSHEAHAWVEVAGQDVGPPPGRMGHREMARFGG